MKNFITILSIVVLFAFAMTTIGCEKKSREGFFNVTNLPKDFTRHGEINPIYTGSGSKASKYRAFHLSGLPISEKTIFITILQISKKGNKIEVKIIGEGILPGPTKDIAPVAVMLKIAGGGDTDVEYEFYGIATSQTFKEISIDSRVTTFKAAWSAIVNAQVVDNNSTVLAVAYKFASGTVYKTT